MTLIETVVAVGVLMIVGGALTTLLVSTISMANAAKIRAVATRYADQKMEQIKKTEQIDKLAIQGGDFSTILALSGVEQLALGQNALFFTRTTTITCVLPSCTVVVSVVWPEKGKTANVTLNTIISKWL